MGKFLQKATEILNAFLSSLSELGKGASYALRH